MKSTKISELLEKINRLADNADFSKLSKLELDLLLQSLRDLYAELDAVRNAASDGKLEVTITKRSLNPNENVLIKEPLIKKEEPVVIPTLKVEKPISDEPAQKQITKSSINESVQSSSSLNERLKAESKEVHKKLSTKPLKDLIDLNKKFILQNELVKGNSEAFSAAVQSIDLLDEYSLAEKFILKLQTENNWGATSQSTSLLVKLVKQKFGIE